MSEARGLSKPTAVCKSLVTTLWTGSFSSGAKNDLGGGESATGVISDSFSRPLRQDNLLVQNLHLQRC